MQNLQSNQNINMEQLQQTAQQLLHNNNTNNTNTKNKQNVNNNRNHSNTTTREALRKKILNKETAKNKENPTLD